MSKLDTLHRGSVAAIVPRKGDFSLLSIRQNLNNVKGSFHNEIQWTINRLSRIPEKALRHAATEYPHNPGNLKKWEAMMSSIQQPTLSE
jgi:hypothetical protein